MAIETVRPDPVVYHCNGGVLVRPTNTHVPAVRMIYLPCTGGVTLNGVIAPIQQGANGVLLSGCPHPSCRFPHPVGCPAERLADRARTLMRMLGLSEERIRYTRCASAAETRAAALAFVDALSLLGPSPVPVPEDRR